jgi:GNAT superfamily N-acetyltransferase
MTIQDDTAAEAETEPAAPVDLPEPKFKDQEPFKLSGVSQSQREAVLALVAAAREAGDIPASVPTPTQNELILAIGESLHPKAVASLSFALEKRMRISCLVVREDCRRLGIGTHLVEWAKAVAADCGCTSIVVDVPAECGIAADALEAIDFEPSMVRYAAAVTEEATA